LHVIAIDGPAGSGKSTSPRPSPNGWGWPSRQRRHVPGGDVRGPAPGVDPDDAPNIAALARQIDIYVADAVRVDGVDATIEIRGPR